MSSRKFCFEDARRPSLYIALLPESTALQLHWRIRPLMWLMMILLAMESFLLYVGGRLKRCIGSISREYTFGHNMYNLLLTVDSFERLKSRKLLSIHFSESTFESQWYCWCHCRCLFTRMLSLLVHWCRVCLLRTLDLCLPLIPLPGLIT